MDTGELTRVFHAATEDIKPRPGFTAAVVRGGLRRRNRNRMLLAGGLTMASALFGAGVHALRPATQQEIQLADPRWSQPTLGDLSGDQAFLDSAIALWRAGSAFEDLRGQPHVYWAGNTPAGPVALLVQQAYLHLHDGVAPDDAGRFAPVLGLVGRDSGSLRLLATKYQSTSDDPRTFASFLLGSTIMIADPGTPLFVSAAPVDSLDGRLTRAWSQIPVVNGMAIAPVPAGVAPGQVKVLARPVRPTPHDKDATGLVSLVQAGDLPPHVPAEVLWHGPANPAGARPPAERPGLAGHQLRRHPEVPHRPIGGVATRRHRRRPPPPRQRDHRPGHQERHHLRSGASEVIRNP